MQTIYNPICHSLYTDNVRDFECLKRCFHAYDIVNDEPIVIYVCSEYFRLCFHKHKVFREAKKYPMEVYGALNDAVSETIGEYVPYWRTILDYSKIKAFRKYTPLDQVRVKLTLLQKPLYRIELFLADAISLVLQDSTKYRPVKAAIVNALINWVNEEKTLDVNSKVVALIKKAFRVKATRSRVLSQCHSNDFNYEGIDESMLVELMSYLFNLLKEPIEEPVRAQKIKDNIELKLDKDGKRKARRVR